MTAVGTKFLGVILAAGKGTRMQPFSERWPKPLLPVGGKPLVVHQLKTLKDLGVRDVLMVIGHLGHEVVRVLGDGSQFDCRIRYVQQEHTLGIAHALSRVAPHVDRPFFLFLADVFLNLRDTAEMLRRFDNGADGVLTVKREANADAMKRDFIVIASADGVVQRVIEKPHRPQTNLKGCGLYLFDQGVFDAVRRTPRSALRDEYELSDTIQIFIDDGCRVEAAEVVAEDSNLTYPGDLLEVNLQYRALTGRKNIVEDGVSVDPKARLSRCVVMSGAQVEAGASLEECLVFPNVVVGPGPRKRTILTTDGDIHCDD